ncbi:MAG: 16S rRNA (uracil(1498)-N(3))-methyltransferase [Treponema sp.]|nr:16S rRNA (uracil(1498)-N(3))-methyltransferase [Treponema sp.]
MKQFILNADPGKDNIVRLEGDDYRYLVRVRRLAAGEYFPALLPGGEEIQIQVISVNDKVLTGKCLPLNYPFASLQPTPPVYLFQSLPKGDKMDLIVRQAAEGGISEIVPFVSEFSIAKANAGEQKISRWERIIKEARQQSGSRIATAIRPPLSMKGLFEYWEKLKQKNSLGLLFHHLPLELSENNDIVGLEQKSLHSYLNSIPDNVAFVIGPEGGFSCKEVCLFMENGFRTITIGDTVLRTETAALYCAAAIRILLLEKYSWELKQA